jgi:hypothetical protein
MRRELGCFQSIDKLGGLVRVVFSSRGITSFSACGEIKPLANQLLPHMSMAVLLM